MKVDERRRQANLWPVALIVIGAVLTLTAVLSLLGAVAALLLIGILTAGFGIASLDL